MAYNNNYNNGGYNSGQYQGGYGGQNNGGYNRNPPQYAQPLPPPPKKSGAKYTEIRKGNYVGGTIVNAWNKSKGKGLITAKVAPYNKSDDLVKSKTGKEYMKMIATVNYHKSGHEKLLPCLMEISTKRIILQDIGMIITPKGSGRTASGKSVTGYFGTMFKN